MTVISGEGGAVDGINTVRNWKCNTSAELQAYIASNTKGGTGRKAGNKDWSGSYDAYGHTPVKMPGDGFTFKGTMEGTKGVEGVALCDSVEIVCDIAAGAIISHVCNFSANGALARGAAVAADASTPDPPSAIGCKVALGTTVATPDWTDIDDVERWTLTITKEGKAYVSSSTAAQNKRKSGNIDFNIAVPVLLSDPSTVTAENVVKAIRLYVTASTYWELKWVMFGSHSDVAVDRETADIVGLTLNGSMNGWTDIGGSSTEGGIWKPSAAKWWPA